MSEQSIALRATMRTAFQTTDDMGHTILTCAWCGGNINGDFDPHHALVKSSTARHPAIDRAIENRVPLHRTCHAEHGQSFEMTVRALDYLCERLGAKRVARWYVELWAVHGLSVARGTLPRCAQYFRCPGCGLEMTESDMYYSDGVCLNYGSGCTWEDALDGFVVYAYATEQEWREYLELVCLPLCYAA
jgi:hypothetical protein